MSKVVVIGGGPQPNEPDPDLIKILHQLLEQAKAGNLRAIGYAAVYSQSVGSGWVGGIGTRDFLSTAIMMLNHRYAVGVAESGVRSDP